MGVKWRSFRTLCALDKQEVDQFLESYTLFHTDRSICDAKDVIDKVEPECFLLPDDDRIVHYYRVLNLLCSLGAVEKMYIPPVLNANLSIPQNQLLFEENFARQLNVGEGSRVLELGCGRGRIAAHVQRCTGANVHGLNIDGDQIAEAKRFAALHKNEKLEFTQGDLNERLPFDDESFDAVYAIQPLTYATRLKDVMDEVYRVVKPGGVVLFLDAVMLDAYDKNDKEHRKLLQETREVIGMGGFWHHTYWSGAIEAAGFDMMSSEDVSVGKHQYPLIIKAMQQYGGIGRMVEVLATMRIVPRYFPIIMHRFNLYASSFVQMDKLGMITSSWQFVARKPEPEEKEEPEAKA